jgi:hypothetical protein
MVDFSQVHERMLTAKARVARGEYFTIIAGSRGLRGLGDYELVDLAVKRSGFNVVKVISGTARGIDQAGEKWAEKTGIPVEKFPANWEAEGKAAGFNRNSRMSFHADALIAIWDGESRGTKHMIEQMDGKPVYVMKVIRYWVTGTVPRKSAFTCLAVTDTNDCILYIASSLKQFIGKDMSELVEWSNCSLERV